jgi:hypothetical protein
MLFFLPLPPTFPSSLISTQDAHLENKKEICVVSFMFDGEISPRLPSFSFFFFSSRSFGNIIKKENLFYPEAKGNKKNDSEKKTIYRQ